MVLVLRNTAVRGLSLLEKNRSIRGSTASEATRICYLHIGTHKTGTTSIQRFLAQNRARFAAGGVFFPQAGCDNAPEYVSHHQLAYELTADVKFEPRYGGLDALYEELQKSTARVACLSSENLSALWRDTSGLVRLRDMILRAGFTPKVVCYLRPQASYCISVYAQIVCNGGYRVPFSTYLDEILTRGRYAWNSTTGTPFDYTKLVDPFAEVFGRESIIVRSYRSFAPDGKLLIEFAQMLLASGTVAGFVVPKLRENGSLDFNTVISFLGGRQASEIQVKFAPLNALQVLQFGLRFRAANAALAARYAVELPAFELIDLALASPFRRSAARTRAVWAARRELARLAHDDARNTRDVNAAHLTTCNSVARQAVEHEIKDTKDPAPSEPDRSPRAM